MNSEDKQIIKGDPRRSHGIQANANSANYTIRCKEELAPKISLIEVDAPLIAKKRKPGNFIILRVNETGERIPLTIVESDTKKGTITLIVQAIGKTTEMMHKLKVGDALADIVGPLGEPTPIKNFGRVVCIGGGVGTAVVYPMTKALKEAGNYVISIIGAKNAASVILEKEMAVYSDESIITTDDGSAGIKGFVTNALGEIITRDEPIDCVFATGPLPMMRAVANQTRDAGIHTMVSLNPIMMDGTGMCGACRVSVGGELKFACVDGPEFDAHKVNFDELISRNNTYRDQEEKALEAYMNSHKCKIGA